jgi:hypothetical protein
MTQSAVLPDAPPAAAKPRRRKWPFRVLWGLLAVVLGLCGYWTWNYRSALAERDALIDELHAKGEPVWWREVVAKALAEEPADSGAPFVREALAAFDAASMRAPPSLPQVRTTKEVRALFQKLERSEVIKTALRAAAPAFALLDEAVRRQPGLLIPDLLHYNEMVGRGLILQVPSLRRLLLLKLHDALARRDASDAYRTAALGYRCALQFGRDPVCMACIARLSVQSTASECLLECIARASVPAGEFQALDELLAGDFHGIDIRPMLMGERARYLEILDSDEGMHGLLTAWGGMGVRDYYGLERGMYVWWLKALASPLGQPIRLRTAAEALRFTKKVGPDLERADVEPGIIDAALDEFRRKSPLHQSVHDSGGLSPSEWHWAGGPWRARMQRRIVLTRLALRLRRHYDQHGRMPAKLDELCDASMPKVSLEWFGDHPITYKPSAKGFRLEVPAEIVPKWERYLIDQTPLSPAYGLEVEFKPYP